MIKGIDKQRVGLEFGRDSPPSAGALRAGRALRTSTSVVGKPRRVTRIAYDDQVVKAFWTLRKGEHETESEEAGAFARARRGRAHMQRLARIGWRTVCSTSMRR